MKKTFKKVLAISFVALFLLTGITILHTNSISISGILNNFEDELKIAEVPVAKKSEAEIQKLKEDTTIETQKAQEIKETNNQTQINPNEKSLVEVSKITEPEKQVQETNETIIEDKQVEKTQEPQPEINLPRIDELKFEIFKNDEIENQTESEQHVHTFSDWEITVTPTCTLNGQKVRKCTECGEIEKSTIEPLGHKLVDTIVEATCTLAGTKVTKCTECDYITNLEIISLPKGHSYGEYVSDNNATCTKDGTKTATCINCKDKKTITDVDSKLGHTFVSLDNSVAPTCETDGKESDKKCSSCGEIIYGAVIKATGHNYSEYVSDNNATCTKDGTKTATCINCKDKKTIADVDSKLDHTFVSLDNSVAPTCETAGKEADKKCSSCGEIIYGAEIKATGHNYGEYVSDNNATCTKDGTKTATCINCKDKKTIADVDSKLDHTFVSLDNSVAPTCETAGKEADKKCSSCGEIIYGAEIKATGHNYGEYVSDNNATEQADGTKTATCVNCGNKVTEIDVGSKLSPQVNTLEAKDMVALAKVPEDLDVQESTNTESTGMNKYNINGDTITVYRGGDYGYVDFAKFRCDLTACVGFDGKSEILEGRRGDSSATVSAPAAKEGYKFKAWVKVADEEVGKTMVSVYEAQYEKVQETKITTLENNSEVALAQVPQTATKDSCDCNINGHKWNETGTACECEHCKQDAQDPESGKVWWSCWGNEEEEYKRAAIWWVNFNCDTSKCVGFDGGKSYISEGRRGSIKNITMSAPNAKEGFTFVGWYNNGSKITDNKDITVSWENMDKCYEARYEAIK